MVFVMNRITTLVLVLFCILCVYSSHASADSSTAKHAEEEPMVCIVIRTYWEHGKHGSGNLRKLLSSFKDQAHQRWKALLLVLDNRPFPDLRYIVKDLNDSRINVFAEWVSYKHPPRKEDGNWEPTYHLKLYNLTDEAIRACPRETEWLLVTNGDNLYDKKLLDVLKFVKDEDIIGFDYYSRYQRATGPPCERFAEGPGIPNCKENELRWCHTDLSANMYRWRKMMEEDWRFGLVDPHSGMMADGNMATQLLSAGWKPFHVKGVCLVEHAPSPQRCAQAGMAWDDSVAASLDKTAGHCLPIEKMLQKQRLHPHLEVVAVNVSHDAQSFGFDRRHFELLCLRQRDPHSWNLENFFGVGCVAAYDRALKAKVTAPAHLQA